MSSLIYTYLGCSLLTNISLCIDCSIHTRCYSLFLFQTSDCLKVKEWNESRYFYILLGHWVLHVKASRHPNTHFIKVRLLNLLFLRRPQFCPQRFWLRDFFWSPHTKECKLQPSDYNANKGFLPVAVFTWIVV